MGEEKAVFTEQLMGQKALFTEQLAAQKADFERQLAAQKADFTQLQGSVASLRRKVDSIPVPLEDGAAEAPMTLAHAGAAIKGITDRLDALPTLGDVCLLLKKQAQNTVRQDVCRGEVTAAQADQDRVDTKFDVPGHPYTTTVVKSMTFSRSTMRRIGTGFWVCFADQAIAI